MRNNIKDALIITMEECGELTQACSKVIRSDGDEKYTKRLRDEIGDVICMIEILKMAGIVTEEQILDRVKVKIKKLEKWSKIFDEE